MQSESESNNIPDKFKGQKLDPRATNDGRY
jgi:hypothetical protein